MKKIILSLVFIAFITGNMLAQNNDKSEMPFIKDRISFNFGMGYNAQPSIYEYDRFYISTEILKGLNNWFEAGIYTTFITEKVITDGRISIFDYGAKGRLHLLHLFVKPSFYRFDLYGNLEVGLHSVFYNKELKNYFGNNYTQVAVNIGGGIGYFFNEFFGIFFELNHSNVYDINYKYGFNFRF